MKRDAIHIIGLCVIPRHKPQHVEVKHSVGIPEVDKRHDENETHWGSLSFAGDNYLRSVVSKEKANVKLYLV